jgi:hypothetical protein
MLSLVQWMREHNDVIRKQGRREFGRRECVEGGTKSWGYCSTCTCKRPSVVLVFCYIRLERKSVELKDCACRHFKGMVGQVE